MAAYSEARLRVYGLCLCLKGFIFAFLHVVTLFKHAYFTQKGIAVLSGKGIMLLKGVVQKGDFEVCVSLSVQVCVCVSVHVHFQPEKALL